MSGWKLVPVKAPLEMLTKLVSPREPQSVAIFELEQRYMGLLAAAPQPPAPETVSKLTISDHAMSVDEIEMVAQPPAQLDQSSIDAAKWADFKAGAKSEVVVTSDESKTRILAVTRHDPDGRIIDVIAEAPQAEAEEEIVLPEHWRPINLVGLQDAWFPAIERYAEELARAAVRLDRERRK